MGVAVSLKFAWVGVVLQDGKLDSAIESLLSLEKQMRLAADVPGTRKVVIAIIELCYEARAWKTLNEQIVLLSKRRSQLKQVRASDLIALHCGYLAKNGSQCSA